MYPVHSGHGPLIPPVDLEAARERSKENQFHCGNCNRTFYAICALHSHLRGGSYHYDHITMTAFPLKETSCINLPDIKEPKDEHGPPDIYYTESGAVVSKMLQYKRKRVSYSKVSVVSKEDEQGSNLDADLSLNTEEVALTNPSNVSFEYPSENLNEANEENIPKSIVFENFVRGKGATNKSASAERNAEGNEKSKNSESDASTNGSAMELSPVVDAHISDKDLEITDTLGNDDRVNLQMTINLHSLETKEDGSLKIVVGEEDAGIFRTPQGEEILKALKEQTKGVSIKNTQIIYNYSVPAGVSTVNGCDGSKDRADTKSTKQKQNQRSKHKRELSESEEEMEDENEMMLGAYGLEAIVFMKREDKINTAEAISILDECNLGMHEDKISKIQPINGKGGELYVVDLDALPSRKDSRHDKYVWYHFGIKKYPKKNPRVSKTSYKIKLPNKSYSDGFEKIVYEPLNESGRFCIIQYIGYESLFKPMPHGNRKHGKKIYRRTCPSVLEDLKSLTQKPDLTPTMIHKQIKANVSGGGTKNFRTPRNLVQIRNSIFNARRRKMRELAKTSPK